MLIGYIGHYKPDAQSPLASPLLWPSGHKHQPPTYLSLCGMDPLRDEGLIYEYLLREEAGVKTRFDVYPGLPHVGPAYFPMLSQAKKYTKDREDGIKWLQNQK